MRRNLTICFLVLLFSYSAWAEEPASFPKGLPPLFGTAIARRTDKDVQLTLTCPQARWQLVGERVENPDNPKLSRDPEFRVQVDKATQTISLRGPARTAKTETRIVGLDGKDLNHEAILQRLAKETPILIAIDGRLVDAYYLQLARPETLIVLLGPWDGAPATKWLPAAGGSQEKQSEDVKALQGTWNVTFAQRGGKDVQEEEFKQLTVRFQDDIVTIGDAKATFTLDTQQRPKHIDLKGKGVACRGIYELDGKKLKLCWYVSDEGTARPASFSRENTKASQVILELTKP